jgi:uncharacterized membrane protein
MAFCPSCGTPVEGRFCAKCGTAVDAGAAPAGPVLPTAAGAAGLTDNVASALCYVLGFITGIIFLVLAPYNQNKTIRFHAFQSIFLSVAWFAFWIVVQILVGIMFTAGILGMFFLVQVLGLAFLVLWIYLIVMAFQGKQIVLPVIGPLAQKQA